MALTLVLMSSSKKYSSRSLQSLKKLSSSQQIQGGDRRRASVRQVYQFQRGEEGFDVKIHASDRCFHPFQNLRCVPRFGMTSSSSSTVPSPFVLPSRRAITGTLSWPTSTRSSTTWTSSTTRPRIGLVVYSSSASSKFYLNSGYRFARSLNNKSETRQQSSSIHSTIARIIRQWILLRLGGPKM